MWPIDLAGQTALVTGASRGIGRAIALGLAVAGAHVVAVARSGLALDELGGEIRALERDFLPLVADIANADSPGRVVAEAWDWHGRVDVGVNAAGIVIRREPPDVTVEDWDAVFATNVRGAFFISQALGPRMFAAGGGSIVHIASLAGEVVTRAPVVYQASKAALIQMTRALGVRWAPLVRVNSVSPGYVRTSLNQSWLDVDENARYVLDRTPIGRVGTPDDVVGLVLFLASPSAGYITAQNLRIDGGWSAL